VEALVVPKVPNCHTVRTSILCVATACFGALACDDLTGPAAPATVRVDPAWVTGAAAAAVDPASGLFRITLGPGSALTIAAAESASLAVARFQLNPATFGNSRSVYEQDRGGAAVASWDRLEPCGRSIRVESPFGPAPVGTPTYLAHAMRSRWAVTLCGPRGDAQLAVSTADALSGARFVGADYDLADLDSLGGMHTLVGIPPGRGRETEPSPEAAVQAVFRRLGVQVSAVPEPFVRWAGAQFVARQPIWRVTLAHAVEGVHDDGSAAGPLTTVFVRAVSPDSVDLFTPASEQPSQVWRLFIVRGETVGIDSVPFAVVSPIVFRRLGM
jgi:hypothetical protein